MYILATNVDGHPLVSDRLWITVQFENGTQPRNGFFRGRRRHQNMCYRKLFATIVEIDQRRKYWDLTEEKQNSGSNHSENH